MASAQRWPLSQNANKQQGSCSVCFQTHQLHIKDNTVHQHGPRKARCPYSNKQPFAILSNSGHSQIRHSHQTVSSASIPARAGRVTRVTGSSGNNSPSSSPGISASSPSTDVQTGQPAGFTSLSGGPGGSVSCPPGISTQTNSVPSTLVLGPPDIGHPKPAAAILKHIPKSARPTCCSALTSILNSIIQDHKELQNWSKLFNFAPDILFNPPRVGTLNNVASNIKDRIAGKASTNPIHDIAKSKNSSFDLSRAVTSKIEDGNIKAAVRLFCSGDKPAEYSDKVLSALRDKHPPASLVSGTIPDPAPFNPLQVTEAEVLKALKAFPAGSSGGPDGLRP